MTSPKKVCYAIFNGEYEDRRTHAVFSTREKAEAKLHLFEEGRIEEFPLDPEIAEAPAGMSPFICYSHEIVVKRGNSEYQPKVNAHATDWQDVVRYGSEVLAGYYSDALYVWAKGENHAIKIAAERFAHHDAIKAGVTC